MALTNLDPDIPLRAFLATTPKDKQRITSFFKGIAAKQGWISGDQLDAYPDTSIFVALERAGEIVGGFQVVLNTGGMLPTLTVWPELQKIMDPKCGNILLLALADEIYNRQSFWLLFQVMWKQCLEEGIPELWSEVPEQNYKAYWRLGWQVIQMGELRTHWGEPCYPCRVNLEDLETETRRRAAKNIVAQQVIDYVFDQSSPRPVAT